MHNIKLILSILRSHRKLTLLAPFLVIAEVFAELLQPEFMAKIVNEGVIGGNASIILPTGIKMFAIVIAGLICGILSIFSAGYVSYHFGADLRNKLFRQINSFTFEEKDNFQASSLLTRLTSDVTKVQRLVQSSMRLLFRAPFLFFGAIIMIFTINLSIVSILIILLPLLIFWIIFILKKSYPLFIKIQEKTDRLNAIIKENLAGIRIVKAYVKEKEEKRRFEEVNSDLTKTNIETANYTSLMMPILSLLINIGIVLVVWIGGIKVNSKTMDVGDILACTNNLAQILTSMMMASKVIMSITEAQASMNRIAEVLNTGKITTTFTTATSKKNPPTISVDNICFKYKTDPTEEPDNTYVLKNITFDVQAGKTLAIIGGTGSGKTTLMQIIAGFYKPTSGKIFINGKDTKEITYGELRQMIGIVFQKTFLFRGTISENLRWGKADATLEEMTKVCQLAQAYDFISKFEDGFDHQLEQGATNLSGGQKQRLSIARTLIAQHPILIIDDCLSAIDFATEAKLRKSLSMINATKIIIAQRISSIMWADNILLLDDGEVKGYGTHSQLLQENCIYQELYNSQTN